MNELTWTWAVKAPADRADRAITEALAQGEGAWQSPPPEGTSLSRSRVQKLIDESRVLRNGQPVLARDPLMPGDQVRLVLPPLRPSEIVPEERDLDVLFEDEHLLVLNKPAGLIVHPSETRSDSTLVSVLLGRGVPLSGVGGVARPGIVHRLDKDTSGAMVVTKTDLAHQRLAETFAKHEIERRYWALCYGGPKGLVSDASLKRESKIGRSPTDRKKMAETETGRKAVSYFKLLREFTVRGKRFASWVEARLETGRTHQVRVHLNALGSSLLGDPVYGVPSEKHPKWVALPPAVRASVDALSGQALHARVLGFKHPVTGQWMSWEADPPPLYRALLKALEESSR